MSESFDIPAPNVTTRRIRFGANDQMTIAFFDSQLNPSASIITLAHICAEAIPGIDLTSLNPTLLRQALRAAAGLDDMPAAAVTQTQKKKAKTVQKTSAAPQQAPAAQPMAGPTQSTQTDVDAAKRAAEESLQALLDA